MTYLDGQSQLQEIPHHKFLIGEDGRSCYISEVEGRIILSFQFSSPKSHNDVKQLIGELGFVEQVLREAGVNKYYILVGSQTAYDFAVRIMGFNPCNLMIKDTEIEYLVKEI